MSDATTQQVGVPPTRLLPTDEEVRAALAQHAAPVPGRAGWWAFTSHLMNEYREADALRLTKVNLMLGTMPNGSITSEMLGAIVERIARIEQALSP